MIKSLLNILNHPLNRKQKIKTLLRILWWKTNQLFFHNSCIVQLTKRTQCICLPNSSYSGLIIYTVFPEYEYMQFYYDLIKPQDIVVDIGANIGALSLLAAEKIKSGKVYAFEPDREVTRVFHKNIFLNDYQNKIVLEEKIVSDKNGFEYFKIEKNSEINHIAYDHNTSSSFKVPSVTLESYMKQQEITKIQVLKVDVEGAEYKVLKGSETALKSKSIEVIILELNKNSRGYGSSNQKAAHYLKMLGYILYIFVNQKLVPIKPQDISNNQTYNIIASSKSIHYKLPLL